MRDPHHPKQLGRLKHRPDFVRVSKGRRVHTKAFTLQASGINETQESSRVGFTLTRKAGCAVIRNRARRRLKEAVRLSHDLPVDGGRDYVLVGRVDALRVPFGRLQQDIASAFRDVQRAGKGHSERPRPRRTKLQDAKPQETRHRT